MIFYFLFDDFIEDKCVFDSFGKFYFGILKGNFSLLLDE